MIQTDSRISREATPDSRSLVDLFKELRNEMITLLRQEFALAKTETSDKVSRVGRNVGYLAAGGLIAYAGALFLMFAAMVGVYLGLVEAGLSNANAGWLASLIIGAIAAIIGYAMIQKAISTLKREPVTLERTSASLTQDKEWIKEKVQ